MRHDRPAPDLRYDAPAPARPQADSVPLAVARVAQFVMFGAKPPPRCGSWPELAAGVSADVLIAEAGVGDFPIPPEVSSTDSQPLADAGLSVELGRGPKQLAAWSGYMGNCLGESWYADRARRERELASARAAAARRAYVTLARELGRPGRRGDFEPAAAVIALKRTDPVEHIDLLRSALGAGLAASVLWRATRVRPLATAVSRLDPGLRWPARSPSGRRWSWCARWRSRPLARRSPQ